MKYYIDLDTGRCIACGACTVACMDQNDTEPQDGDAPLRRCVTLETGVGPDAKMTYLSVSCLHCDDAPCMQACPTGCIRRDDATGFVVCDNADCIGCRSCAEACPVAAPVFDRDGKMRKCDGCCVRVANGLLPACVKVCPLDALRLHTEAEHRAWQKTHTSLSVSELAALLRGK